MSDRKILKLGVLISGNGTNLQAIIDSCKAKKMKAEVAVVISDNPEALGLQRAKAAGVPGIIIERKRFPDKPAFEHEIVAQLKKYGVELVCLAGYMRIVGPAVLAAFKDSVINIHPALLPSFPGLHGQQQALEHGVKVTGCTVHFVDDKVDHGPIICQAAVEVKEGDTIETLTARVFEQEHRIYSLAIGLIAEGRVKIDGRRVKISSK